MFLRERGKKIKMQDGKKKKKKRTLRCISSFGPVSLAKINSQRSVIPKLKIFLFT